jgi:serine/threonine protein kinase
MEYADGGDLFMHLKKYKEAQVGGTLPEIQVINLFVQVTMAVRYMHDRKLLHRDIKSQNVFLTQSHVVKLGDFGISTVLQNTMAMAKTICGTPCYFSPELCNGRPYNNKSDIWALGVLLYEMAGGKLPFESANMKRLMDEILTKDPPRIPRCYSDGLWRLIQSMLHKDPLCRPDAATVLRSPVLLAVVPGIASQLLAVAGVIPPALPKPRHEGVALPAAQNAAPPQALSVVPVVPEAPEFSDLSPIASVARNMSTLTRGNAEISAARNEIANAEHVDVKTEEFDDDFGTVLDVAKLQEELVSDSSSVASDASQAQLPPANNILPAVASPAPAAAVDISLTGACLCRMVSYSAPLSSVYGSFSCSCEACRRLSGAPVVEWLHLPASLFPEISVRCSGLRCYSHGGFAHYFCRDCGSSVAMEHEGIEGSVVTKSSLDAQSLLSLSKFQHAVPR